MRFIKEPLIQFLVVGMILFGADALWGRRTGPAPAADPARSDQATLNIDAGQIEELRETYRVLWNRPPTVAEMRDLIEEKVREEVLYLHALELGLDRDDLVVRRRLIQRVRFLTQDLAASPNVDDATLQAHLTAHADYFADAPRVAFEQVAFSKAPGADRARQEAADALARWQTTGGAPAGEEESASPVRAYPPTTEREIAETFGSSFAETLLGFEAGSWQGPIESRDAFHIVRVTKREPARVPPLEAIRDRVRRDYEAAMREEANEAYYRDLRQRYAVTIDEAALANATRPRTDDARAE
ncbi:MAG: peptidyl-prolyl cis-trans isomerase [Verrucomicrobiales bacterium]|nr:peptidyl-prolyl cis-trans isomerase [Verrucomicrobiales bacterium]MCP5528109.1 peptidyl-prolyl cis-trans isomerase [Verrucomicrobiales bacterium]